MFGCGVDWTEQCLLNNAPIQPGKHARISTELLSKSRYLQFLSRARPILMRLLKKYDVKVDYERYFIVAMVHSIDHY